VSGQISAVAYRDMTLMFVTDQRLVTVSTFQDGKNHCLKERFMPKPYRRTGFSQKAIGEPRSGSSVAVGLEEAVFK
jgi:hypothetical protein